jgi:hypothetical protein
MKTIRTLYSFYHIACAALWDLEGLCGGVKTTMPRSFTTLLEILRPPSQDAICESLATTNARVYLAAPLGVHIVLLLLLTCDYRVPDFDFGLTEPAVQLSILNIPASFRCQYSDYGNKPLFARVSAFKYFTPSPYQSL